MAATLLSSETNLFITFTLSFICFMTTLFVPDAESTFSAAALTISIVLSSGPGLISSNVSDFRCLVI